MEEEGGEKKGVGQVKSKWIGLVDDGARVSLLDGR